MQRGQHIYGESQREVFSALTPKNVIWAGIAFIAAQRFILPDIVGYVCLLPFLMALVVFDKDPRLRNTLLLLALFWSTDNAVLEFGATHSAMRYLIYITTFAAFIHRTSIHLQYVVVTMFVFVGYLTITLFFQQYLSTTQMFRDMQIFLVLSTLFCFRSKRGFDLDLSFLFIVMIAYLVSENLNFFLFRSYWYGEYMSFDTTKYLVVFPSIYALMTRRFDLALALLVLTVPVLIGYTSRALLLAFLATVICVILFVRVKQRFRKQAFIGIFVGVGFLILNQGVYTSLFESFKALNTALIIQNHGLSAIRELDPVRYGETLLFFQLPLPEIFFGRGFGSGIEDTAGLLAFVSADQDAFSIEELNNGYFYNFHDAWVDIGLRFGLLPFTIFLVWVFRQRVRLDRETFSIWLLSLIGIFIAFYGVAGFISTIFLIRVATNRTQKF